MKKSIVLFFAVVPFLFSLLSCSQPDVYKTRTITVSGTGRVFVTPDKATVNLAVITRNNDIHVAQRENSATMARVQDAILEEGIPANDIQTYDYGISQDSYWKNDIREYGRYNVTNRIKVNVTDIDKASNVIDVAIKNGATGVDSLSFSYEDEPKAVKRARMLAIENARTIAEESVKAAGTKLGKVLVIGECTGTHSPYMMQVASNSLSQSWNDMPPVYAGIEGAESSSTPLSSGSKEIKVIVDIMYELK